MRPLLMSVLLLLPLAAYGQVATDDHALDSLPASQPVKPAPAAPAKPAARSRSANRPGHPASPHAKPAPARTMGQVRMPAAPPANPVLAPPPFVMPAHAPPPPPTVPMRADAVGGAAAIAGGLRLTFGAGSAELNEAMVAAIRTVATQAVANPAVTLAVTAWAPGTADDPSTPRRVSLDRALAVRAVLINAGIASERIRTVARGTTELGGGPADRADLLAVGGGK